MRCVLPLFAMFVAAGVSAAGPSAPSAHIPPVSEKSLEQDLYPLPRARVAEYLSQLMQVQTVWNFRGRNETLKAEALADAGDRKALRVATGLTVALGPEDLFQAPFPDGPHQVFLGGVTSADAEALRVQADLSALADDEELWLIDPVAQRPFGPYTRADHTADGRWLPTVEGDTAVLMVRSSRADFPQVRVPQVAHFFWTTLELKELSCNVNIACETDPAVQEIAAGVGMMVVPNFGGDQALCSGTLINNPDTPEFEPYFITANHCVPGAIGAGQVDVIWDYRASACGPEATVPTLGSRLRSNGESVLVTSASLDATLMRLDSVPVGPFGRTYVGWSTTAPIVGDDGVVIHHPAGSHMRISYAEVKRTDVTVIIGGTTRFHETEVQYPAGVTEGGSSGSCLLLARLGYALVGMLSGGPVHTCGPNRSGNTDEFASFRHFYNDTDARLYLSGTGMSVGAVTVTIEPASVRDLGAAWAVDGGPWHLSGTTVSGLAVGQHSVAFAAVAGWNAPPTQSFEVAHGQTTEISATYTRDILTVRDVNRDGHVNALDVQTVINRALGLFAQGDTDINGDGKTDALDVQLVINGALGLS